MKGKLKILMVIGSTEMGGAQTFILNVLRNIDRSIFQIDFAINSYAGEDGIEAECRSWGCNFHIVPYFRVYNYFDYCKSWESLLSNNHYDIVYAHSTSSASIFLGIAKKHGCKTIAHSHSTGYRGNMLERCAKQIFVKGIGKVADYWFACSDKAAEHLYGNAYKNYPFYYNIPNAIDATNYLFDECKREQIRKLIGVEPDTFLCGHVGSFSTPKNHMFLLEIFNEVINRHPNSKLVCCGAGQLMQKVKDRATELGIIDNIIFPGVVGNANEYMMAMDAFIFPSIFEGFPISILEAQATGLHIVMSDVITKEVDLTDLICRQNLQDSPAIWAEQVLKQKSVNRTSYNQYIADSKFNIKVTVKKFENMYIELVNNTVMNFNPSIPL